MKKKNLFGKKSYKKKNGEEVKRIYSQLTIKIRFIFFKFNFR